ncbi:MAG: serine/threonine-protein phosphatase, partial [Lachnospiraceae bacterium]|nr:serine/threonine-protein phosphatase [Candidatus Equihabitans merdae]
MQSCAATDVGQKRKVNQDYLFESQMPVGNLPNLFIVADGMGGHNAGDYASRFAVKKILETIENSPESNPIKLIESGINAANTGIRQKASEKEELHGMGTTCVVATVIGGYLYVANVGDSRLYMRDDDTLTQITRDHSLVEEMVRIGQLTAEEARRHPDKHIITRALGAAESVNIDFFDQKIPPEGELLMCS